MRQDVTTSRGQIWLANTRASKIFVHCAPIVAYAWMAMLNVRSLGRAVGGASLDRIRFRSFMASEHSPAAPHLTCNIKGWSTTRAWDDNFNHRNYLSWSLAIDYLTTMMLVSCAWSTISEWLQLVAADSHRNHSVFTWRLEVYCNIHWAPMRSARFCPASLLLAIGIKYLMLTALDGEQLGCEVNAHVHMVAHDSMCLERTPISRFWIILGLWHDYGLKSKATSSIQLRVIYSLEKRTWVNGPNSVSFHG